MSSHRWVAPVSVDEVKLEKLVKSGKVHVHQQVDGSWDFLPRHHGFCSRCGFAFGTDPAFEAHLFRGEPRGCISPAEAGLAPATNRYGTVVWRIAPKRKSSQDQLPAGPSGSFGTNASAAAAGLATLDGRSSDDEAV